jgi:hypothetical protein
VWWSTQAPWIEHLHPLLRARKDELKSLGVQGLVRLGVRWNPLLKSFESLEGHLGWGFGTLHGAAVISELQNLGLLLEQGESPWRVRPSGWTQVIVVSTPPWPAMELDNKCNSRAQRSRIEGLTGADHARIFWHDIHVPEAGELWTGGLDGKLATVRGHGASPGTARLRALALAGKIQVPERQLRTDVGGEAEQVFLLMDELGWL